MDDTRLTPHGALLERARGSTSKRQAARDAGISEGRWRQIVTGVQKVGGGVEVPANPKRETLIDMARAVGADVAQVLEAAGMVVDDVTDFLDGLRAEAEGTIALADASDYALLEELGRRLQRQGPAVSSIDERRRRALEQAQPVTQAAGTTSPRKPDPDPESQDDGTMEPS